MTALPNIEKHICFQVKQLPSFKLYHFRSERNKGKSIFKASPGSDKCSINQSQLEASVLTLVEQVCTLAHLCLRGLGWGEHCLAPWCRGRPFCWPSALFGPCVLTSWCFSFGPAALYTCAQTTLSLGSLGGLIPFTASLLQPPQPWALLGPKVTKLTLLSCFIYSSAPLSQECVQNPKARPKCPVWSGSTGTLPCQGAEIDGLGTSTHSSGSAGDTVSEGTRLLRREAQSCRYKISL